MNSILEALLALFLQEQERLKECCLIVRQFPRSTGSTAMIERWLGGWAIIAFLIELLPLTTVGQQLYSTPLRRITVLNLINGSVL
jgi:hypothetical protein